MSDSTIKNLMVKDLVTVAMGKSVNEAKQLMQEKRIRHLPVVDELDDVVGIVSYHDIRRMDSVDLPVEVFMNAPVHHIKQNFSLRAAILKMIELKISCLLVSDDNGSVSGIITSEDLLWHLAELLKEDEGLSHILSAETVGNVVNQLSLMGI